MPDENKSLYVTRVQFYTALAVVWLYIMLVIGDLQRVDARVSTGVLWVASLGGVILYSVMSFRARRSSRSGNRCG